jgi:radical SAM-linked protein
MIFSKTEAMRFTSHLDLHTTLERTMRRANLPLAYSQGFTPRPKLSLASALPLGYTSEAEAAEFWLTEAYPAEELAEAIQSAAPPGIVVHDVLSTDNAAPKLQNALSSAVFQVSLREPDPELPQRVEEMMSAESLPRERIRKGKKKTYDLRPLILSADVTPATEDALQQLHLHLRAEPGATGRPDEVLKELGLDPLSPLIHRTELVF